MSERKRIRELPRGIAKAAGRDRCAGIVATAESLNQGYCKTGRRIGGKLCGNLLAALTPCQDTGRTCG